MTRTLQKGRVSQWSRLRTRMGISYVVVTLIIVLLLESLVVTAGFIVITRSPIIGYFVLNRARNAAQIYALQAAVQASSTRLNSNTTFEPGQAASLSLQQEGDPSDQSFLHMDIPFVEPGSPVPSQAAFALLIDPNEQVLASSIPERYPPSTALSQTLPDAQGLVRRALGGKTEGDMTNPDQGRLVSVAQPVWNRDRQPLGVVYIQAPAGAPANANLINQVLAVLIPSGLAWLCFMVPIGLVFGVITTRHIIRRIERLAGAAAKFAEGDIGQRVPVSRPDEIGQLEQQFNQMAEQLVESFDQREALAEQSARREERARIEQEMSSARYIQQSLLPEEVPSIQGWQIEPYYCPALEVGGDWYDFLPLPDGRFGIVIGDVTGKSMPAALIMATTCAMLRAAAPGAASPGEVLALVNNLLQVHIPAGMFATCFYAILDPANGHLCFANAGHNIPYLVHDGEIRELRATGMPLGLMPEQVYEEQAITFTPRDSLLFYTDGLVEAHAPNQEMFGGPRLRSLLQSHAHLDGTIASLLEELQNFTGAEWEQEDDVTLVILRKTD